MILRLQRSTWLRVLAVYRLITQGYTAAKVTPKGVIIVAASTEVKQTVTVSERVQNYAHILYYGLCVTLYFIPLLH